MSRITIIKFVVAIVLLASVAGGWYLHQRSVKEADQLGRKLINEMFYGNFDEALATYRKLRTQGGIAPSIIAGAERDAASLSAVAENSTNVDDIIENIRSLKKVVVDKRVEPAIRAEDLNVLIQSYSRSGENPKVLEEMFKDEPYKSYFVEGKTGKSLQNLYRWSLRIYPTARAAISIAAISTRLLMNKSDYGTEDQERILQGAIDYLQQAEELADRKMSTYALYPGSVRYIDYRVLHAYTVAGLAVFVGEPYKSQYKKEYDELISFIKEHENEVVQRQLVSVYWNYAVFLSVIDKDIIAAGQQLTVAAQWYQQKPFRPFEELIRNKKAGANQGYMTENLFKIADTSPEFKALIDSIQ